MPILRASSGLIGALFLVASTVNSEAASAQTTIQVNMSNYEFTPSTLQLRANNSYRLRLTNASRSGHSFDAPQLFAAANVEAADQSKVVDGEVEVDGGQTVEVNFTPTRAGAYKFHCSHFLHSAFGMHGEAIVQ